jgi:hypothetical protein
MMHFLVLVALFLGYAATPTAAVFQVTQKDTSTPTPIPTTAIDTNFPNNVGIWNVSDATLNKTCIVFKAAIQLTLQYNTTTAENKTVLISVPTNASSTGRCTDNDQILVLNWNSELETPTGAYISRNNSLQFNFSRHNSKPAYFWIGGANANIHKDSKQFPNATNSTTPIKFTTQFPNFDFRTNQNHSYKCNAQVAESEIKFANMQFEAFRSTSKANFTDSIEDVCAADSTSLGAWAIFGIVIGQIYLFIKP